MFSVTRYHDFSAGHRVVGHENKCALLHGHNYRVHFHCRAKRLDNVGRVLDFSVINSTLCQWLEDNWDHKFLVWQDDDEVLDIVSALDAVDLADTPVANSFTWLDFNPTAENMAQYLVEVVGPRVLAGTGVELIEVTVEETRKCSATYKLAEAVS